MENKLTQDQLHWFLNATGFAFEQFIPLRGAAYNDPLTRVSPECVIDYVLEVI